MKRILSLLLAALMLVSVFVSCGSTSDTNEQDATQNEQSTKPSAPEEPANPKAMLSVTPKQLVLSIGDTRELNTTYVPKYESDPDKATFVSSDSKVVSVDQNGKVTAMRAGSAVVSAKDPRGELTASCSITVVDISATLKGSIHMPPVDSQGNIGCCAHESVTYAQFTIAVSQYMNKYFPDKGWNPSSGDLRYLFSPKFTYNLAGAGTEYAYNILMDHGCLTEDKSRFYHSGEASLSGPSNAPYKETASWDVSEGLMEIGLRYRLTGYEEIDYTGAHGGNLTVGGTMNLDLLNRVKAAVTDGNAVVICGWSSYWNYGVISKKGDIAKVGEDCIYSADNPHNGGSDGNHAVTIVGYDDTVEAKVGGITLKGAFQVLNSWGSGYCNDGYIWMMYDAFNTNSEYEILNNPQNEQSSVFAATEDMKFIRLLDTKKNFLYDFKAVGTTTVDGKTYNTYTIYDPETKQYLGYDTKNVKMVGASAAAGSFIQWAIIPYADVCEGEPAKEYEDSVVLYAFMRPGGNSLSSANCFTSAAYYNNPTCTFKSAKDGGVLLCMTISGMKSMESTEFTGAIQLTHSMTYGQSKAERTSTIYRFSFIDWRKHITVGTAGIRIEAEVSTTTRENFKIDLLRVDASGNLSIHRPWLFEYGTLSMHNEYLEEEGQKNRLSFSGVVDPTKPESGFFTLTYNTMDAYADTSSYENFLWGIRITGTASCIKKLKLIAPNGTVLSQIVLNEEYNTVQFDKETSKSGTKDYFFDLGKPIHTFTTDGQFYMKNAATGVYVGYKLTLFRETTLGGDMDMLFNFTTDPETGEFVLRDDELTMRMDIYKTEIGEGTVVKFNNTSPDRTHTQAWTLVNNPDGTVSFHLTKYPEYYLSYNAKATGVSKYVLSKDKDSDYCKWILEGAGETKEVPEITFSGATATYKANKPAEFTGTTAILRVMDQDGALVSETNVTFSGDSVTATVNGLQSGKTYMFMLTDGKNDIGVNYIIKCK